MKGVMRSWKRGKLSLRYECPYDILQKVGIVAYALKLPTDFASIYLVVHVSILNECLGDLASILLY